MKHKNKQLKFWIADDGSTAFPELVFVLSSKPRLNNEASRSLVSKDGLNKSNNLIISQSRTAVRWLLIQSPRTKSPNSVETKKAETHTDTNPTLKIIKLFNMSSS